MNIGDTIAYKGEYAEVIGFKGNKFVIETLPPIHPTLGEPLEDSKKLYVDEKECRVIKSFHDHFFVLKITGRDTKAYPSLYELRKNITKKNFNKSEIYEVKKLGKPIIIIPYDDII